MPEKLLTRHGKDNFAHGKNELARPKEAKEHVPANLGQSVVKIKRSHLK